VLIAEECDSHNCSATTKAWKDIEIEWYSIVKDPEGREVVFAKGLDGVSYNMVIKPKSTYQLQPYIPNDFLQDKKPDEDLPVCKVAIFKQTVFRIYASSDPIQLSQWNPPL
jgi:hypothetical protein